MILKVEAQSDGRAKVFARSVLTGKENVRTFPLSKPDLMRGLADHAAGALIQHVFPDLSADEREFLITGTTSEEWDAAFDDDYDDDDEEWYDDDYDEW